MTMTPLIQQPLLRRIAQHPGCGKATPQKVGWWQDNADHMDDEGVVTREAGQGQKKAQAKESAFDRVAVISRLKPSYELVKSRRRDGADLGRRFDDEQRRIVISRCLTKSAGANDKTPRWFTTAKSRSASCPVMASSKLGLEYCQGGKTAGKIVGVWDCLENLPRVFGESALDQLQELERQRLCVLGSTPDNFDWRDYWVANGVEICRASIP